MGYFYDALTQVAALTIKSDQPDRDAYDTLTKELDKAAAAADTFVTNCGMYGDTRDAAVAWLADYQKAIDTKKVELANIKTQYETARNAVLAAITAYGGLSSVLMSPAERKLIQSQGYGDLVLDGVGYVSPQAYISTLIAQRDAVREEAAADILKTMNLDVTAAADFSKIDVPPTTTPDTTTTGSSYNYTWNSPSTGGGSATGPTGTGLPTPTFNPPTIPVGGNPGYPTPTPPWRPPTTGSGSASNPIDSPVDLRQIDVTGTPIRYGGGLTSDGPVFGYNPPSVLDGNDPRWGEGYTIGGSGGSGGLGAGIVAGGILGVGATALASRALGSALSGVSALAFGTAAGSGNAAGLSGMGLGLGMNTMGAGGRVPGGGMIAGQGVGASAAGGSGKGGSAYASQGANGNKGAAGAAGERGKDDKKRRRRGLVGYDVQRLEDEGARVFDGPGDSVSAGSSDALVPLTSSDEGDRW